MYMIPETLLHLAISVMSMLMCGRMNKSAICYFTLVICTHYDAIFKEKMGFTLMYNNYMELTLFYYI